MGGRPAAAREHFEGRAGEAPSRGHQCRKSFLTIRVYCVVSLWRGLTCTMVRAELSGDIGGARSQHALLSL